MQDDNDDNNNDKNDDDDYEKNTNDNKVESPKVETPVAANNNNNSNVRGSSSTSVRSSERSAASVMVPIDEENPATSQELKVDDKVGDNNLARAESEKRLSKFSVQFDFDGDGKLNAEEERVRNMFKRNENRDSSGGFRRDVFYLAKEQALAAREAQHFKKMAMFFSALSVVLLLATFGLVIVAVNLSKETVLNGDRQFVSNDKREAKVSVLGSSNLADQVEIGDAFYGSLWEINFDFVDTSPQYYAGTVPKSTVEEIWKVRRTGVQGITTEIFYYGDSGVHNWVIEGNIDLYEADGFMIYQNLETSILPGWKFTVYCPIEGTLCAVTQAFRDGDINVTKAGFVLSGIPTRRRLDRTATDSQQVAVCQVDNSCNVDPNLMSPGSDPLNPNYEKMDETLKWPKHPASQLRRMTVSQNIWSEQIAPKCWITDYKLLLFVRSHIVLVAVPPQGSDCPVLGVDVDYDDQGSPIKKVTLSDSDEVLTAEKEFIHALTETPTVPLKEIAMAVNDARASKNDSDSLEYSLISNNCATFILDILNYVHVELDDDAINFITQMLMRSEKVVSTVHQTYDESYTGYVTRRMLGDTSIVRKFVLDYVQESTFDDL